MTNILVEFNVTDTNTLRYLMFHKISIKLIYKNHSLYFLKY